MLAYQTPPFYVTLRLTLKRCLDVLRFKVILKVTISLSRKRWHEYRLVSAYWSGLIRALETKNPYLE